MKTGLSQFIFASLCFLFSSAFVSLQAKPLNVSVLNEQKKRTPFFTAAAKSGQGGRPALNGKNNVLPSAIETRPPALPEITWRLENPFRFFEDPADTSIHRATWQALSPEEHEHPVLASEHALSERLKWGWASRMFAHTCWDVRRNRHRCGKSKKAYVTPDQHVVLAKLENISDASDVTCNWLTAPKKLSSHLRGQAIKQPCDQPVRLEIPYPYGTTVDVEIGGRRVARTTIKVTDLLIVGMGDSFASGEGNPDLPVRFSRERTLDYGNGDKEEHENLSGYPVRIGPWRKIGDAEFQKQNAQWIGKTCHRSLYSHQLRAALQLAIEDPQRAVTYVGLSCSGAEVTFGMFLRYKGNEWVPNPPEFSQISAVARAQCGEHRTKSLDLPEAYHINGAIKDLKGGLVLEKCPRAMARKIDLLLVSIGGNDIGFARLLANAILKDRSMLRDLGGWMGEVHGKREAKYAMRTLGARYKSLNRAFHNLLHIPWRQSDRIVLTAYPSMALLGDGSKVCPDGNIGMEVAPEFSLSSKRARESQDVAEDLNKVMKKSAHKFGWTFVEEHRKLFIGRGICAGFTDHAFSTADDLRLPRKINGNWVPYNPSLYRPYATRQRWFRTPNDAFLTDNFHVSTSILQKVLKLKSLRWFQLLLAATYSGAFHPTAEGQAAIADAIVLKARRVLKKYGQAGRIRQVHGLIPTRIDQP